MDYFLTFFFFNFVILKFCQSKLYSRLLLLLNESIYVLQIQLFYSFTYVWQLIRMAYLYLFLVEIILFPSPFFPSQCFVMFFFPSHIDKSHLDFKICSLTICLQLSVVEIQESQPMAWDMVMIMLLDKTLLICANLAIQWKQTAP